MPPAKRLELAGNIWQHFGPRSVSKFTVGPNADAKAVLDAVYARLDKAIEAYRIPEDIRARFEWLSGGDTKVKELLLNYFPAMERKVASEQLQQELPILQKQMREYGNQTVPIRTTINIQRHSVIIYIDRRLSSGFYEGVPLREPQKHSGVDRSLVALIGVIIVISLVLIVSHLLYTLAPALSGGPNVGVPTYGSISFAPAPQKPINPAPLPIPSATEPAQRADVAPEECTRSRIRRCSPLACPSRLQPKLRLLKRRRLAGVPTLGFQLMGRSPSRLRRKSLSILLRYRSPVRRNLRNDWTLLPKEIYSQPNSTAQSSRLSAAPATETAPPPARAKSRGPSVGVLTNGSISLAPAPQKPINPAPLPIPSAAEPAQRADVAPEAVYSQPNSTVQSTRLSTPPATETAPPPAQAKSRGPSVGVPTNGSISLTSAPQKPINLRPLTASLKSRPPPKIFSDQPKELTDPAASGVY